MTGYRMTKKDFHAIVEADQAGKIRWSAGSDWGAADGAT